MNKETMLNDYIKLAKSTSELKEKVLDEHDIVSMEKEIKIKSKYSWLFLIPLIAHLIIFQMSGEQSSLIDKIWINPDANHLIENFDHFYWVSGVLYLVLSLTYYVKTGGLLNKIKNEELYYDPRFDPEKVSFIAVLPSMILFITASLSTFDGSSFQVQLIKFNFIILLSATLIPLCIIVLNRLIYCKKDLEKRRIKNEEDIKEWSSKNQNANYLKERVILDSSIMKHVLTEYESPLFEFHPDKNHYIELLNRMKKQNEKEKIKNDKIKEFKGAYETLYKDKIDIKAPVVIEND